MANYSTLKAAVTDVVKTNGEQAITGANMRTVLLSIINSIGGGGYIFEGVATPSTDAGTPDQNVFYIGGAGTYANFGTSVVVPPTNIAVFKYNGTWTCEQVTVENGGVFDISAFKAVGGTLATYADLSAALGTNGANVPVDVRKGGMSVKFVLISDNKYVQYMYNGTSTAAADFTNVDNWEKMNLEEEVSQLGQNVNELNLFSGVARATFIDGYYIALSDPENTISTTPIEKDGASYSIVPCKQGENFIISATPLTQIGSQKMYVFTDGNYVCKLRGFIGEQLVDYSVIAPVDGYFIINASANATRIVYKGQLGVSDSLSKSLAKLGSVFAVYGAPEALAASNVESNTIYTISNIYGSELNDYNTLIYDVRYLDVLSISVLLPPSNTYKLAMFYDANNNFVGCEERHNGQRQQNKEVVVVPQGAVKMRISSTSNRPASVEKLVISPSYTPCNQLPKTVILKTDGATISMNTYKIEMTKHGHNNMLDIRRILDSQNNAINLISTDWQGPYEVSAINNVDGDAIEQGVTFTGGNHAYSYDGESGTPTGRTIEFHLFADGVEITDVDKPFVWNDNVELRWKNRIQGWNTKKADGTGREILEETPSWTFFADGTIKTSNYITALEDIYIYMYYGMQMSAAWMNGGVLLPSASRQKINRADFTPEGLGTKFAGVEVTSLDSHVNITMGYNPFVDLGDGNFIGSAQIKETRIHTSTSKLYIYMIYKQNLLENDIAHYEGYYHFSTP